jgi:hypothetical protein
VENQTESKATYSGLLARFEAVGDAFLSRIVTVGQWVPHFFHLRTPWQSISINCILHISKMFVINIVAVISILYVVTVNK